MEINLDPCLTSMSILQKKIHDYFQTLKQENSDLKLWFPDCDDELRCEESELINIVLFGDFVRRFFETGNWFLNECFLHVLSSRSKAVLCQQLGITESKVKVIPRYELFPFEKAATPTLTKQIDFVFAGRISATKNIDALLFLVSHLQKTYQLDIRLHLFGEYDDEIHEDLGRRIHRDYQARITELCSELDFTHPPVFYGKLGSAEWLEQKFIQPVFISLSTYISEDFGVSVAQAQSAGWPCILSDWGGHKDVTAGTRILLDSLKIPHSHERVDIIKLKSEILAAEIHSRLANCLWDETVTYPSSEQMCEKISLSALDESRRNQARKLGSFVSLINREKLDQFSDTPKGEFFFHQYRKIFAGGFDEYTLVIVHDLDHNQTYLNFPESFKVDNPKTIFLSSRYLFSKMGMDLLLRSQKIISTLDWEEHKVFYQHLKQIVPAVEVDTFQN